MIRWNRAAVAVLTFAVIGCASAGGGAAPATTVENTAFASSLNVNLATMTKLPSGMYYEDLELGTGAALKGREEIKVHYTGWLSNGEQFETNKNSDEPITVPLGRGAAIEGWDKGLIGMRVGGLRRLVIPPSLGYGSTRRGPIPADAVLVFDLTLVSAK